MDQSTQRSILLWIHIIFGIPIIGYIYSSFEKLPDYAPVARYVALREACLKNHPDSTLPRTAREHQKKNPMQAAKNQKLLSPEQNEALFKKLQARFEEYINRHKGLDWAKVKARLEAKPEKLWPLHEMEKTGGEPDVVGHDKKTDEYLFFDCSPESPDGRTSVCYDREGLESRKEHKPKTSAMDMAADMGIEMLTEDQYRELQKLGNFDRKSSSWVQAPTDIRKLGGALFGDRRYGHVFIYHNGAQSYYSGRGFRGSLKV